MTIFCASHFSGKHSMVLRKVATSIFMMRDISQSVAKEAIKAIFIQLTGQREGLLRLTLLQARQHNARPPYGAPGARRRFR
jgi:hypothetical protein